MVALAAIFLSGCIGSGGSSAPAPNNVHVVAKDSRAIVTWDGVAGVEYWIFHANGSGVTPQNCSSMPLCYTAVNVTSPASISGLYNDYLYSFSINGRIDGGPGGEGSAAVDATPRPAGATWTTDASPTTSNLLGITYGAYDATGSRFVAAGTAGALYSGTVYTNIDAGTGLATTGITWSQLTNPLLTTDFNAVNYDSSRGKYLSVGAGGKMIAMTPSTSTAWAELTSYTGGQNLLAIANNGAGFTVVTGAAGTIITSGDGGATWTVQTSGTSNALNGVAYGYDSTNSHNTFVAVGVSGTILYSADAITWTAATSGTASELKSVTYGGLDANDKSVFVAVGAGGTVLTSPDGITWTAQTSISAVSTATLNAVAYSAGRRFVAVAANGNIYYSNYYSSGTTGNGAVSWTQVAAPVATLNTVATGGLYDFSAVGNGGLNAYAD